MEIASTSWNVFTVFIIGVWKILELYDRTELVKKVLKLSILFFMIKDENAGILLGGFDFLEDDEFAHFI